MVLAITVFSIVFLVLFTTFMRMVRLKNDIEARQTIIKSTYNAVEKINTTLQNYTIDYEEYFNRSMVWCNLVQSWWIRTQGSSFVWNPQEWWAQTWHCLSPTWYGNNTAFLDSAAYIDDNTQHRLYACSSDSSISTAYLEPPSEERLVVWFASTPPYNACSENLFDEYVGGTEFGVWVPFIQPYGEYRAQFIDVKADVDDKFWRAWDDDDTDLGKWPIAIQDANNAKELYLISKDKLKRILFRRALVSTNDWNNNGSIDAPNERLYSLQMLQLRAFDAGSQHNFDAVTYSWVYDGKTDTWACDAQAWFICHADAFGVDNGNGITVWGIYDDYRLPLDENDWWVNITTNDISITDWNMRISPVKDPDFARWEANEQRNPFITLYLKTTIYWKNRSSKLNTNNLENITFDLQTSFNIKTNY
jgi:hypothetical protein